MYVAMNRFRIAAGHEEDFAEVWRNRESRLDEVPGFVRFRLLEGARGEAETPFISYSEWDGRASFDAWTRSEAFARAHRRGRTPPGLVLAHPRFEGYEVVVDE